MESMQHLSRESIILLLDISVITFVLHICETVINYASVLKYFTMFNFHIFDHSLNSFVKANDIFAVWTGVFHILARVHTERNAKTETAAEKHNRQTLNISRL